MMEKITEAPRLLPNVVTSGGPTEDKRRSHDGMDGASEDKGGELVSQQRKERRGGGKCRDEARRSR